MWASTLTKTVVALTDGRQTALPTVVIPHNGYNGYGQRIRTVYRRRVYILSLLSLEVYLITDRQSAASVQGIYLSIRDVTFILNCITFCRVNDGNAVL